MGNGKRILIVDDEPNIRLMFRTSLESGDYVFDEAEDGEAALAKLHEAQFDLVLLDLRMPLIDGMATLHRMRDEGITTPVVMITAHGSIPDAVEAMKLGAIDFIEKPMKPEVLRSVVAEVVERHSLLEPGLQGPSIHPAEDWRYDEVLARAKRAMNHLRPAEAEELLRRALDLEPQSAEAHTLLGVLLMARGEPYSAYQEFQAALEADPDYEAAKANLRHYKARFSS